MLSTIEQYARDWEELASRRRESSSRKSSLNASIQQKQAEIGKLGLRVNTVGESDLAGARTRRNELWELIRSFAFEKTMSSENAQKQTGSRDPLPVVFAQHLRQTDEIADLRFSNAKDVVIHDRLVKEIASTSRDRQLIDAELVALETDFDHLRRLWASEWSSLAADPLSPAEMKEWVARRQKILDRLEQRRGKEIDGQLVKERAAVASSEICARLRTLGSDAAQVSDSLSVLLNVAEKFARQAEDRRRTIHDLRRSLQAIDLARQQTGVEECKNKLLDWTKRWSPLMLGLFLPPDTPCERASVALGILEKVFLQLEKSNDLQHRIDRIGENIAQFEADAGKLCATIDSSLTSLEPLQIAVSLQERLVETGKAETRRVELENQNERDEVTVTSCRAKAQSASATLQRLMELARCGDYQDLEASITAAEEKAEKQEVFDRIASSLVARNATPDLNQIEEESSSYDLDSLHNEVGRHELRQKGLQAASLRPGLSMAGCSRNTNA